MLRARRRPCIPSRRLFFTAIPTFSSVAPSSESSEKIKEFYQHPLCHSLVASLRLAAIARHFLMMGMTVKKLKGMVVYDRRGQRRREIFCRGKEGELPGRGV